MTAAIAAKPTGITAWKMAIRPPTLTASVAPVLVGCGVAIGQGAFSIGPALAALFGAIFLQIGANFANDVFDFQRGADTSERLGPPRVTQQGILSPAQMKLGMVTVFAIAMLIGIYLVYVAGWPIVAVGLGSIVGATIYTGGPWPIGYHALGDVFTFSFFGPVAVVGTYFVQAGETSGAAWFASIAMGAVVTMILVVNNLRDIDTDRHAGKTTLGVLMGDRATRTWYFLLLAVTYAIPVLAWPLGFAGPATLVALLSLPAAYKPAKVILDGTVGRPLNPALRDTARLTFWFGLAFAVGLSLN
jgi:1,4-dihydroxy-2-naphthoate octaprenyltransferase